MLPEAISKRFFQHFDNKIFKNTISLTIKEKYIQEDF